VNDFETLGTKIFQDNVQRATLLFLFASCMYGGNNQSAKGLFRLDAVLTVTLVR